MAREYYSVSEAAKALGISLDTLRRWDRTGRIKTERDAGNRRSSPAARGRAAARRRGAETLSARNRFNGIVTDVKVEGLLARSS